ncbi:hypothetical protein BC831DRAFT_548906 [Entophlyctis helioformis]|nr:hypothetical protein BC831DRAFT_548906 [Entophlyctis helioformis]
MSTASLSAALASLSVGADALDGNVAALMSDLADPAGVRPKHSAAALDAFLARCTSALAANQAALAAVSRTFDYGQPRPAAPSASMLAKAADAALAHLQAQTESLHSILLEKGVPVQAIDVRLAPLPPQQPPQQPFQPSQPSQSFRPPAFHPQPALTADRPGEMATPPKPAASARQPAADAADTGSSERVSLDMDASLEAMGISALSRLMLEGRPHSHVMQSPVVQPPATPRRASFIPRLSSPRSSPPSLTSLASLGRPSDAGGRETRGSPAAPVLRGVYSAMDGVGIVSPVAAAVPTRVAMQAGSLADVSDAEFKIIQPFWKPNVPRQFLDHVVAEINEMMTDKRFMALSETDMTEFSLAELLRASQMELGKVNDVLLALLHLKRLEIVRASTDPTQQIYRLV